VNGLPVDYGSGGCQVVAALMKHDRRTMREIEALFSQGDVSRCYIA
jgi:hypothetical protein